MGAAYGFVRVRPPGTLRAPVRNTCARIAIPPTCCGHIDQRIRRHCSERLVVCGEAHPEAHDSRRRPAGKASDKGQAEGGAKKPGQRGSRALFLEGVGVNLPEGISSSPPY